MSCRRIFRVLHHLDIKLVHAVEHDLNADAHQDEGRQANQDAYSGRSQKAFQPVGKTIREINGDPNEGHAYGRRDGAFDVVVANISAPAVAALLPDLRRVCRGVLILSGFSSTPAIPNVLEVRDRDGWQCVIFSVR